MDTQLNALPSLPVRARTVSGCWNSAFSRHFSTIYGLSVQSMDTQLNALPPLPVLRSRRFWLLELRVSRTFLDQLRPQLSVNQTALKRPWAFRHCRHFPFPAALSGAATRGMESNNARRSAIS